MGYVANKDRRPDATSEAEGRVAPSVAAQGDAAPALQPGSESGVRSAQGPGAPVRIPGYTASRPMVWHGCRMCTVVSVPVSSNGQTYPVGYEGEFTISDIESLPHCLVPLG